MNLKEYFDGVTGVGVLSTADKNGMINSAIYARPHVNEFGTVAFIMRDRKSHQNVIETGNASFLFKENSGYRGVRLTLKFISESDGQELIAKLKKRVSGYSETDGKRFLVNFSLIDGRKLLGDEQLELD